MYDYQAKVVNIHDGDTVTLDVDLGFNVHRTDNFRLYGINAPELVTPEGKVALAYLLTLVKVGDTVEVKTIKDNREKYGRYLGVILNGTVIINDAMVAAGHAVPYSGGKR